MPLRPCLDCGTRAPGARCPACRSTHERQRDQRRGGRQQRGYDREYERERDRVLDGATTCATCGEPFGPTRKPTGGHVKDLALGGTLADGLVAECERCNFGRRRSRLSG